MGSDGGGGNGVERAGGLLLRDEQGVTLALHSRENTTSAWPPWAPTSCSMVRTFNDCTFDDCDVRCCGPPRARLITRHAKQRARTGRCLCGRGWWGRAAGTISGGEERRSGCSGVLVTGDARHPPQDLGGVDLALRLDHGLDVDPILAG